MTRSENLLPASELRLTLQALARQPQDQALRLRLLRHYHAARQAEAFIDQALRYRERPGHDDLDASWAEVCAMGRQLLPQSSLFMPASAGAPMRGRLARERQRFAHGDDAAAALQALATNYRQLMAQPQRLAQIDLALTRHAGRPTPLYHAQRLSQHDRGAAILFKQEALQASDAHLTLYVCGQALLAQAMGHRRLVTATINGSRGRVTAAVAARLGLQATVHIDRRDAERQRHRMLQMRLMGAQIVPTDAALQRRGDIREAALSDWLADPATCTLVMGLDGGPEPYPTIARDIVSVVGRETRRQMAGLFKRLPLALVTRAGDNADALGLFPPFLGDAAVRLVRVAAEAPPAAPRIDDPFAVTLSTPQQRVANAILEGLAYPGVGRELSALDASGRIEAVTVSREDAWQTLIDVARFEGLVLPVDSAAAVAWARQLAAQHPPEDAVVVVLGEPPQKQLGDLDELEARLAQVSAKR